jgi:hypothetical protein
MLFLTSASVACPPLARSIAMRWSNMRLFAIWISSALIEFSFCLGSALFWKLSFGEQVKAQTLRLAASVYPHAIVSSIKVIEGFRYIANLTTCRALVSS